MDTRQPKAPAPHSDQRTTGSQPAQSAPAQDGRAAADSPNGQAEALKLEVPQRPQLTPGVKPAGQVRESAFVDPPWLLEREGAGYIQVTALLYQIAEQCTGDQTLDQIAEQVSQSYGKRVTSDNVRQLIASQLLAKGLVVPEGATPQQVQALSAQVVRAGGHSPLAINMKTKTLPPERIEPLARLFTPFFWPPVLVGVLVAAALAQGWLYFVHGVGDSVAEALYAPGLMLLVLLVIVLSAGFHEFGHAAGLAYGGGKVKGMGAGIYLVYPAFFTDVSDNYRLSRWSRVRTDLAGFYFNLIFALGIMGIYVATGQEFLLLIVTLINFSIIHQLLPFVRLDGYWTLADVTGVPDFFSQMGAFVRSVLPGNKLQGRKLPELKWWAKLVFGAYMLITIPVLAFLLVAMIQNLPRLAVTAWDSAGQQARALGQASGSGDVLGMLAAALQMIVLALPTLGAVYTLYRLARGIGSSVWNWSKPSPVRRGVAGLGTVALVGFLVYSWVPRLPFETPEQPAPLRSQQRFEPIRRGERLTAVDAVTGAVVTREPRPGQTATPAAEATPATPAASATTVATPALAGTSAPPTAQPTPTITTPVAPTSAPAVVTPAAPAPTAPPATRAPTIVATAQPPSGAAIIATPSTATPGPPTATPTVPPAPATNAGAGALSASRTTATACPSPATPASLGASSTPTPSPTTVAGQAQGC